jgi:hypothetical protein
VSFAVGANKKQINPVEIIEKMSSEERRFYLPYLPNSHKKNCKSPS